LQVRLRLKIICVPRPKHTALQALKKWVREQSWPGGDGAQDDMWLHAALDARAEDLQCRLPCQGIGSNWVGWPLTHKIRFHTGGVFL